MLLFPDRGPTTARDAHDTMVPLPLHVFDVVVSVPTLVSLQLRDAGVHRRDAEVPTQLAINVPCNGSLASMKVHTPF